MKKYTSFVLSILILSVVACSGDNPQFSGVLPINDDVKNAPQQIVINGKEFSLTSYLWRDFMPIAPKDGHELAAVIRISTIDSTTFPNDVTADVMWVLNGAEYWAVKLSDDSYYQDFVLAKRATGGPKWDPGTEVEVIVRLYDSNDNSYYVKESKVGIHRTD